MKILALDSTADVASVAICDDERLIACTTISAGLTHSSELLLPLIEELMGHTHTSFDDIGLFALSAGPGSFTGVRIGAATIKGLAYGRNTPCIGVSTLASLAHNLISCEGIVCAAMNARRSQVYCALFEARDGKLCRLCPDRALPVSELCDELEAYSGKKIFCVGDGAELVIHERALGGMTYVPDLLVKQNAYSVALCALEEYRTGVRTTDAELVPTYLRLPQAERERLERLGQTT